eukprot:gene4507-4943_t
MSRLNNFIKFSMINLNILASLIGLALFAFSFYLWFSDWGALDKGFFAGMGALIFLFGLLILFASCIGCQGITNQTVKFGLWTGRKIMAVHIILLALGLAIEVYIFKTALYAVGQYEDVYNEMVADPAVMPDYVIYEGFIADKFNRFFFGASSECQKTVYSWFWSWVDGHCPSSITSSMCQGCHSYSLTFCQADADLCFDTSSMENNSYCPYTLCREDILHYIRQKIIPFSIALGAIIVFQIVLIILDILIFCYHPRDSWEQILYKSGTVAKTRFQVPV